jgi:hypothetical protein
MAGLISQGEEIKAWKSGENLKKPCSLGSAGALSDPFSWLAAYSALSETGRLVVVADSVTNLCVTSVYSAWLPLVTLRLSQSF